ncbi:SUF system NifU family Fe-S cluster assembly protein [Candidatus Gracilibacteria bacterium]|nr:SUF system NifU family Fe-S cluster assembly protein [Candidatus Gracilibacteria bacterium]
MDLYTEIILDHYKDPQNSGTLTNPTVQVVEHNPTCGDKIHLDLKITDNKVTQIAHESEGCAISIASMSLVSDEIIGKSLEEILKLDKDYIFELLHVEISAGRIKCALLGLAAIKHAILQHQQNG